MNRTINNYDHSTYVENISQQTVNNISQQTVNNTCIPDTASDVRMHPETEEEPATATDLLPLSDADKRIREAIEQMVTSGVIKNAYDYAWIMLLFMDNKTHGLPYRFDSVRSFINYLTCNLGMTNCPDTSSLNRKIRKTKGMYPQWNFEDADGLETKRRNGVAARFLNSYRNGSGL